MKVILINENYIYWIFLLVLALSCRSIDLYGRSTKYMSLEENLNGMCQYIENIEQVLNQTESTSSTYEVAWIYGYLSGLLSVENHKLKAFVDAYDQGNLLRNHTKQLFDCFQKFIKKLAMSNYIYDHKLMSTDVKKQYLPATEDIRSIMESGVLLSFFMEDTNEPKILRDRFMSMYQKREQISDPVNKLFEMLIPRSVINDSFTDIGFISQIPSWTKCNNDFRKLNETLMFLNTLQRYLISGLFAEELYLLLGYKDLNQLNNTAKYVLQLEKHRTDYRLISQSFIDTYAECYTSLKKKGSIEWPKFAMCANWNSHIYGIIIIGIIWRNIFN